MVFVKEEPSRSEAPPAQPVLMRSHYHSQAFTPSFAAYLLAGSCCDRDLAPTDYKFTAEVRLVEGVHRTGLHTLFTKSGSTFSLA